MQKSSLESVELATLMLARRIVLARAAALDSEREAMAAMHSAPFDRIRASTDDDAALRRRFDALDAEMARCPVLLLDLERRIDATRRQLIRA